jgi:hypothetical protein
VSAFPRSGLPCSARTEACWKPRLFDPFLTPASPLRALLPSRRVEPRRACGKATLTASRQTGARFSRKAVPSLASALAPRVHITRLSSRCASIGLVAPNIRQNIWRVLRKASTPPPSRGLTCSRAPDHPDAEPQSTDSIHVRCHSSKVVASAERSAPAQNARSPFACNNYRAHRVICIRSIKRLDHFEHHLRSKCVQCFWAT